METKLIFICYSLAVGGAERRIAAISSNLAQRGCQVKIVLLDKPRVAFTVDSKVEIVFLGTKDQIMDLTANTANVTFFPCPEVQISCLTKAKLALLKLCSKRQAVIEEQRLYLHRTYAARIYEYIRNYPDWIIMPFMSFCNVSTMMALEKLPNRVIYGEATSPEIEFPAQHPMNALKRRYYPRANGGVFQTPDERDFYDYLHCHKWVIPNPLFGYYPSRHEGIRRKEIVTFCRVSREKNLPLLIDSCAELFIQYPDYCLSIYGDGAEKNHLIEYVHEKSLDEKVIFHDFDIALHDKIKDCAMFVSTSNREGISNSMLEAMAIGLPTICTDCPAGGARMMITPYENGLLVPCRDKEALAKAMTEVIENPDLAEKMSKNSVKIRERLNIGRIVQMWMDAIEEVSK